MEESKRLKIAIVGTKGIPARHGGFETCVEEVSTRLARRGHRVILYYRSGADAGKSYRGVKMVRVPELENKYLATLIPTLLSVLSVAAKQVDVVHIYGVGNSVLVPLLRCVSKKTIISVDALDWKRSKWNRFASWYLRIAERVASLFADCIVVDNLVVSRYYHDKFNVQPDYVPYGAEVRRSDRTEALEHYGLEKDGYLLFVGRLKPEKGVHKLIQAFDGLKTDKMLAIVGDDPFSKEYIIALKSAKNDKVKFLGYVYGEHYRQLCSHAYLYATASEVEGTSPALVAAMGYGNCVVVNAIPENLETIGDAGVSFCKNDVADLRRRLQELIDHPGLVREYRIKAQKRVAEHYNWDAVTDQLEKLYGSLSR
jgi:glycosyltransferase involved in cell wall biosynthesis